MTYEALKAYLQQGERRTVDAERSIASGEDLQKLHDYMNRDHLPYKYDSAKSENENARALWQSLEGGRLVLGRNLEGVCGSLDRWTDEGKRVAEEAGHCMELWQEGKDAYGNSLPVQMSRMMYQPAPYPQRVLHTGPDTFQDGDLITITINGTEITGTMEESPADA